MSRFEDSFVELDRAAELNNLTSVYIPPVKDEVILYKDFSKLGKLLLN